MSAFRFVVGHFASDEIKEKIDDLDQKWGDFKVWSFFSSLQLL